MLKVKPPFTRGNMPSDQIYRAAMEGFREGQQRAKEAAANEPPSARIERIRQIAEQEDTFPASTVKFLLECIDRNNLITSVKLLDPKPGQIVVLVHPPNAESEALLEAGRHILSQLPEGTKVVFVPQDFDLQVAQPEQTLASLFGR